MSGKPEQHIGHPNGVSYRAREFVYFLLDDLLLRWLLRDNIRYTARAIRTGMRAAHTNIPVTSALAAKQLEAILKLH